MQSNLTPLQNQSLPQQSPSPAVDPAALPGMAPWLVALIRALGTAIFAGLTVFLTAWTQTNDPKTLAIVTLGAVLPILAARFGFEGNIDQARAERAAR